LRNDKQKRDAKHQGVTVEVTVALQLNQGERKKSAVYLFFLDFFFVTFFCIKTKESKQKVRKYEQRQIEAT